mgnify:CR=1 FL=1|tara:strand:+ start:683 stop:895 length:213 start_codon:yes stop_codon:yes gene_type:complete
MAYAHTNKKGQTYYLHSKDVTLKSTGRIQTIYYFAKEVKSGAGVTALDSLPSGKQVVENERTGLPFLKKA